MSEFPSFFRLNTNPLHEYTTFCLCIHLTTDTWCFYPLAIVNNAIMNMFSMNTDPIFFLAYVLMMRAWFVQIPVQYSAFNSFRYIFRSEIARLYGNSIFNFLTTIMFSIVARPFHIPPTSAQGFLFLHILANTVIFCFFGY